MRDHPRRVIRRVALAFVLAGLGCEDPASHAASEVVVRDSASVRVVEYPGAVYLRLTEAVDTPQVVVTVGSVEGEPHEQFFQIGPVRWIDSDRVALAHSRSEVRVFDSTGNWLRSFGRRGDGPGEYQQLRNLLSSSQNHLILIDVGLRRITRVDSAGRVVESVSVTEPFPRDIGLVEDSLLVGLFTPVTPANGPRIERRQDSVVAFSTRSGLRTASAPVPGHFISWVQSSGVGFPIPLGTTLTPSTQVDARGGRVLFGNPETYRLEAWNSDLGLTEVVRVNRPANPVTDEIRAEYSARWDEGGLPQETRPGIRDSVPHFNELVIDHSNRVWVRLKHGGDRPDLEWDVFSADGLSVNRIWLPEDFKFRDANNELIVGVSVDELGVEYLQYLRLPDALQRF